MTDRSRRVRRQISDVTDDISDDSDIGSGEDYDPRRTDSMRRAGRYDSSPNTSPASSRPRRGGNAANTNGSASVQRGIGTADDRRQSLKLTVKAPPSKLREVMRANEVEALHDVLGGGKVLDGPRSTRRQALAAAAPRQAPQASKPRYAEVPSDDDEEDEEDEEEDDDDAEDDDDDDDDDVEEDEVDDEDTPQNDFDELGAEPEGGTEDDEDVEMEEAPPSSSPPKRLPQPKAPKITLKTPARNEPKQTAKPKFVVTPANVGPLKSVEDQEMEDDPDDEEDASSELSEEDDDGTNLNEEDVEGEEDDAEAEEDAPADGEEIEVDDEDDDLDSDSDGTPASGSATPDLSRMTKRQRGREEDANALLSLDMAPQQRKFFTDEEKAMRKDEHARKRKELTKRKVQEEKTAALNRLNIKLKPQASKARGAAPKPETLAAAAAAAASPFDFENAVPNANPIYTRWISTKDGIKLGVPEEWLGKSVGSYFGPPLATTNGGLIQEVD